MASAMVNKVMSPSRSFRGVAVVQAGMRSHHGCVRRTPSGLGSGIEHCPTLLVSAGLQGARNAGAGG